LKNDIVDGGIFSQEIIQVFRYVKNHGNDREYPERKYKRAQVFPDNVPVNRF
jgi:hypothetical protein